MPNDDQDVQKSPIHILTLDGGGIRGLSSLLILRELMGRIAFRKGRDHVRPCDCFQLIIGTGTGGISALLLGRMCMTVEEAIVEYIRVMEISFKPVSSGWPLLPSSKPLLDGTILEHEIGEVVNRVLGNYDAGLAVSPQDRPKCRTAILAATSASASAPPYIFRSYTDGIQPASSFKIHEVARATASTPGLFAPVTLGSPPMNFIDAGAAGYNNPSDVALHEAHRLWPGRQIGCFVSLGTGLQHIVAFDSNKARIAEVCRDIIQNCETVHDRMLHTLPDGSPYFRFNVDRGLDGVDIMEWKQTGPDGSLPGITDAYMRWREVDTRLNLCVLSTDVNDIEIPNPLTTDAISSETREETDEKSIPGLVSSPKIFNGRRQDIEKIAALILGENTSRVAILGADGIGKTSIALTLLRDARVEEKFQEHRQFIACEGIDNLALLVDVMRTSFGIHDSPTNPREDLLFFLQRAYASYPLLLVIDNFETVWESESPNAQFEAEEFLRALGNVKQLSLILTMRGGKTPAGSRWWSLTQHVDSLDPDAARSAFREACVVEQADDDQLDALLRAVEYVPLAVILMARLGQNTIPSELLKRWNKERDQLPTRPRDKYRAKSVDISIDLAIRSDSMKSNASALLLLSVVSVLPSGAFQDQLPQLCPQISNPESASATLCECGLAYHDEAGTFRVLPPIRSHVLKHYPVRPDLMEDIKSFYLDLIEQVTSDMEDPDNGEPVNTTLRDVTNIEVIITRALNQALETGRDENGRAVEAALRWTAFLQKTSPRSTIIKLAVHFLRTHPGKKRLADCLKCLGDIQCMLSEWDDATTNLTDARWAFESVNDQRGVAGSIRSLGEVQRMQGKTDAAISAFAEAASAFKAIKDPQSAAWCSLSIGELRSLDHRYAMAEEELVEAQQGFKATNVRRGVAACLLALGKVHFMTSKFDTAKETLAQARDAFENMDDGHGVACCMQSLGEVQYLSAEYDSCRKTLDEALLAFQEIKDQRNVARCRFALAKLQSATAENEAATENVTEARRTFEDFRDQQGIADCLRVLGELQHATAEYKSARETLTEAQRVFESLNDPRGIAWCLHSLGQVQYMTAEYDDAHKTLDQARDSFQAINDQRGFARSTYSLGELFRREGNDSAAGNWLLDARRSLENTNDRHGLAVCLQSLGLLWKEKGRKEDAREAFTEALEKWEALGSWTRKEQEECNSALRQLND